MGASSRLIARRVIRHHAAAVRIESTFEEQTHSMAPLTRAVSSVACGPGVLTAPARFRVNRRTTVRPVSRVVRG